jgi:predicted AlkP superfamily pyrophosphatase or phosphodiesterase
MAKKPDESIYLPDYKNGSIVNLMSSIMHAFGERSMYGPLQGFDGGTLRRSNNVVLLVLDGLGYEYLKEQRDDCFLRTHLNQKITAVFPSTTAAGITTFLTGLAPQQHAITGWFMLIKELGLVARILPFNPRYGGVALGKTGVDPRLIFTDKPLSSRLNAETHYIIPQHLFESDYTLATSTGARKHSYNSLSDCMKEINDTAVSSQSRKFLYVYWAEFDSLCHEFGTQSPEVLSHFRELNHALANLADSLKGSNTELLITSDHGLVDTETIDRISLEEHPELAETLTLPLCGEPRVVYCYVHPSKVRQFRSYVSSMLNEYCMLYSSRDLIRKKFFGLHQPNPRLFERIGDYVLIMKDNYVIKDCILGETMHFLKANHGGVSSKEMFVPLITATC